MPIADPPPPGMPDPLRFVRCVTCESRLRVTDPAMIGTLANCPKCGSIVAVSEENLESATGGTPPPPPGGGGAAGRGETVDSDAVTRESIDLAAIATEAGPGTDPPSGFRQEEKPEGTPPPDGTPRPDETPSRSHVIPIGAITAVAVGIIAALAAAGVFRRDPGPSRTDAVIAKADPPPAAEKPNDDTASADAPDGGGAATAGVEPPDEPQPVVAEPPNDGVAAAPPAPDPATTRNSETEPATPPSMTAATGSGPPVAPEMTARPAGDAPDDRPTLTQLPEGLAAFGPLLLAEAPRAPTNLPPPPSMDDLLLRDAAATDDPLMPVAREPIRPERDLRLPLAIAARGDALPPTDVTAVLTEMTAVPIEWDLPSMDVVGTDPRRPMTIPGGTPTAEEWLNAVAVSVDAVVDIEPHRVVIRPRTDVLADAVKQSVAPEAIMGDVAPLRTLTGAEDPAAAGGDDAVLVAVAAETIARGRDGPGRMSDAAWSRWGVVGDGPSEWPIDRWAPPPPATPVPMSVATFLRRYGRAESAAVMIHWDDLTRRDHPPGEMIFPDVEPDPATVLARTLQPLGVRARDLGDGYRWVGTDATYDRLPIVRGSPPLGANRPSHRRRFDAAVANLPPGTYAYAYDAVSDRAFTRLPRFIDRQWRK